MNEFEKMTSGLLYDSANEDLWNRRVRARLLVEKFNNSSIANLKERVSILKELIPHSGANIYVEPNIRVEYGENIYIGDNFFMNFDGQILDVAPVHIGNNVLIGARVSIVPPVHPLDAYERRPFIKDGHLTTYEYAKPITIDDDVWIASSVTICGGVHIGKGSVIGAGSVVTRNIPEGVFACGVPCKVVRDITEKDKMYESQGIAKKEDK